MTRRAAWTCLLLGVLVLFSIPVGLFYWWYGRGSILIVTNVGHEDLTMASAIVLWEGGPDDAPRREWARGTVRPGESVEIELEPSNDANAGIRFTTGGSSVVYRIRWYISVHPTEIRAHVTTRGIERVLAKLRRKAEYDEPTWGTSPK